MIITIYYYYYYYINYYYSMLSRCSRVFKTPQELEVIRFTNRVSSEAHKEVIFFYQANCQLPAFSLDLFL